MRINSATKGSRMKAIVSAISEVMKNSRPKYKMAIITPIARIGNAMWRASRTALPVLNEGFVTTATVRFPTLCLDCSTHTSIMKLI